MPSGTEVLIAFLDLLAETHAFGHHRGGLVLPEDLLEPVGHHRIDHPFRIIGPIATVDLVDPGKRHVIVDRQPNRGLLHVARIGLHLVIDPLLDARRHQQDTIDERELEMQAGRRNLRHLAEAQQNAGLALFDRIKRRAREDHQHYDQYDDAADPSPH